MAEFQPLLEGGHFYEGPRWRDGRLWVSDFFGFQVQSTDTAGDVRLEAKVPNRPSGLGWLPDGRMLIVSMLDQKLLRREKSGELVVHADLSEAAGGYQINDMAVDEKGNAYVGSFGFDPFAGDPVSPAPLIRVAPDGTVSQAAHDLLMPNGMAILPGNVLVVAQTVGQRLTAFDIQPDGSLANRREWAVFGPLPESRDVIEATSGLNVGPDGLVADAEGAIWVADAYHNRVIRVAEGGTILQEISTGDFGAYAPTLGGPDGRTLFICVAPDFDPGARSAAAEAKVFAVRVDVPGQGW